VKDEAKLAAVKRFVDANTVLVEEALDYSSRLTTAVTLHQGILLICLTRLTPSYRTASPRESLKLVIQ
jgi:hypothetical protein